MVVATAVAGLRRRRQRLPNRCARGAGFTLPELLIVLGLLAVSTALTVPHFLRETAAARAARAAEDLANAMRLARFRAISLNRSVYVHLEPDAVEDFYTAYVNLGEPGETPAGTPEEIAASRIEFQDAVDGKRGNRLPAGVSFFAGLAPEAPDGTSVGPDLDLPANPIVFNERGTVEWPDGAGSQAGTIYLSHDQDLDAVRAVTLDASGFIRVWYLIDGSWK